MFKSYEIWCEYVPAIVCKNQTMWHLEGIKFYNDVPIRWTIASSESKEELLVWTDMNNIKVESIYEE